MPNLISIKEAAQKGITKLRMPGWGSPEDHIKIDIIDGKICPWVKLFSPMNERIHGTNPLLILITSFDINNADFLEYQGE